MAYRSSDPDEAALDREEQDFRVGNDVALPDTDAEANAALESLYQDELDSIARSRDDDEHADFARVRKIQRKHGI